MNTLNSNLKSKHILLAGMLSLGAMTVFAVPSLSGEITASYSVSQQSQTVKGVVVDKSTGEPIIGANVVVKGTTNGVITDFDGNYTLDAPVGSILVISYIGYQSIEVKAVAGVQQIRLGEDTQALEEVVVVGYGVQKKATVTGSVSTVKGSDLKTTGTANITNTFAGKLPGVVATNRSGEPGNDYSDILIRGKGSLNDNSPLIVIDGVANRGGLERLNPSDIESVNVLKDASAAIYGAQAANGVILVTTKRGTSDKPTITYNGSFTLSGNTRTPDLMNAYQCMTWTDEIRKGNGQSPLYENIKGGYLDGTINRNQYGDTDWMDVVFRSVAPQTRHSLSVSGGSEKVKFYVSGDYSYQEPNYRNTSLDFQTGQVRSNIDAQISDNLKIGVDLAARREKRNNSVIFTDDIFWEAFMAYPWLYDYYPNGLPGPGLANGNNLAILVAGKETGYNRVNDTFVDSKFSFDLKLPWITEGLSLSGYAAFDYHAREQKQLWDVWDTYDYNAATGEYIKKTTNMNGNNISLRQDHDDNVTKTFHLKLDYQRTFGDHRVGAFVAYEQSKYEGENFYGWRGYYLSNRPDYLDFGADKEKTNGGRGYVTARQNYFGRLNYAYKDRYMFEFTLRHDGSMNFAPGHRWGAFPAFSLGWVMSEEEFFQPLKNVVSFFKVKGSWGMMGNDNVTAYQYMSQYKFIDLNNTSSMCFGDEVVKAIYESRTANPLITWEKAKTWNLGFSSQFLDGKFGLDFDYFQSRRNDILITRNASIPTYSGLVLPAENLGKVKNHGLELIATYRDHSGDFSWGITGNFTYANNKVVYEDEAASTPEWQRRTGHPIDGMVLYKALGIYQTQEQVDNTPHIAGAKPGDLIYQDTNGDGNITWDDAIRLDKSATPKIIFGLTLNGAWKGWDLNVFFQGQADAEQLVQPTMNMATDFYEGRWIETNTAEQNATAKWPRAFIKQTYGDAWNGVASTWWLRDASFVRLKSIELGYTLPKMWTKSIGIENARIYVNGNNLFTIDGMKICDPEAGMFKNTDGYVVESGGVRGYPLQRMITVGANVTF